MIASSSASRIFMCLLAFAPASSWSVWLASCFTPAAPPPRPFAVFLLAAALPPAALAWPWSPKAVTCFSPTAATLACLAAMSLACLAAMSLACLAAMSLACLAAMTLACLEAMVRCASSSFKQCMGLLSKCCVSFQEWTNS
eukprot:g59497.t1